MPPHPPRWKAPAEPAGNATRWPAEWEPHTATWLTWPHNPLTWPGHLEAVRREYAEIVRALQGRETVRLLVNDAEAEAGARAVLAERGVDPDRGIQFLHVPTDDSWIRDYGPIFVEARGPAGAHQRLRGFGFDAWGGKYPPWERDAAAAGRAAALLGCVLDRVDFVLEGGSIDGNGAGTVLTTEACLLNPNREKDRTRGLMEDRLSRWLGARHVIWLGDGIEGDDTDGHVDDVARFVGPRTVVIAQASARDSDDHRALEANLRVLRAARDQDGRPLELVILPMPPPHAVDGQRCPASYANFYLANGVALVPVFGAHTDARALAVLREALPDRDVVGVPCATLVLGLGTVHCLSQQEPAPPAPGG
jgi:agmatine deiminase